MIWQLRSSRPANSLQFKGLPSTPMSTEPDANASVLTKLTPWWVGSWWKVVSKSYVKEEHGYNINIYCNIYIYIYTHLSRSPNWDCASCGLRFSIPTRCKAPTASLPSLPSGFLALCSAPLRRALWAEWNTDGYALGLCWMNFQIIIFMTFYEYILSHLETLIIIYPIIIHIGNINIIHIG